MEICGDNRFELIEKYKQKLMRATNIEQSVDEMSVIDSILFRFWQMGWLDRLEAPTADVAEVRHGKWEVWENHPTIYGKDTLYVCSECTAKYTDAYAYNYCPHCGAKMDAEGSEKNER